MQLLNVVYVNMQCPNNVIYMYCIIYPLIWCSDMLTVQIDKQCNSLGEQCPSNAIDKECNTSAVQ